VIATIREDGSPQATPVWIDYDGENVLVNSAHGRTKVKNIERDPRATVYPQDQQSGYVMVSGTAKIVEEGALEHINMLAKKYLGEDKYPYLGPGHAMAAARRAESGQCGANSRVFASSEPGGANRARFRREA
jgi:PPOX class probable F420-dependent enzyme